MIEFICGDCGHIGNESKFFQVPKGSYQGDSEIANRYARSNNMKYMGCPDCQSPNLYFDNQNETSLDNDILFDENNHTKDKKDKDYISTSDENSNNNSFVPQIAPPGQIVNSVFDGMIEGSTLIDSKQSVPQEVDPSNIPNNNIVLGDINKQPKRQKRMFRKKCYDCGDKFETKHSEIRLCKRCLQGLTRRRN